MQAKLFLVALFSLFLPHISIEVSAQTHRAKSRTPQKVNRVVSGRPKALQPRPLQPGQFKSGNFICTILKSRTENEVGIVAATPLNGVVKLPAQVTNAGKTYKVTYIPSYAFANCNISRLILPKTINTIDRGSFNCVEGIDVSDISILCNINHLNGCGLYVPIYLNGELVKDLVIPSGVESISDFAFASARKVRSVTIPASVTYIGKNAIVDLTNCVKIVIEDSSSPLTMQLGRLFDIAHINEIYIGRDIQYDESNDSYTPFEDLQDLSKVEISKYVTRIPARFLCGCHINEFIIPKDSELSSIGPKAFLMAYIKNSLYFPESVRVIDNDAFSNYVGEDLSFPGVILLGDNAFIHCGVKSLDLGKELEEIGKTAFYQSNINKLMIPASVATVGKNLFNFSKIGNFIITPVDKPGSAVEALKEQYNNRL